MLIRAAAPAFKSRSLAALRRNPDGTIYLDQGLASTEPQALRVRIRTSSIETGSSTVPLPLPDDAPIESTVLQARNTIFVSELWQELNRESRLLGPYGVRAYDDSVICPLTPQKVLVFDLVPLATAFARPTQPDNNLAEGICLALQLFLSMAHRRKHRSRTHIPPAISNQQHNDEAYSLLRPLITRMNHQSSITSAHNLFKPLCAVLASAKVLPEPSYDIETTPPPAALASSISATEATILTLADRLESIVTFKVTETTAIIVKLRTAQTPACSTNHVISLSPDSPLNITCKAPRPVDQWSRVEEYVLYATSCALAASVSQPLDQIPEGEPGLWEPTISADTLRKVYRDDIVGRGKQLIFQMHFDKGTAKLQVKWENGSSLGYGTDLSNDKSSKKREGTYEWKSSGDGPKTPHWEDGEGELIRSLEEVIEEAGRP